MSDETEWVNEIVHEWIGKVKDVETLRGWIEACHLRIVTLGGPARFGIDLTRNRRVFINGTWFDIIGHHRTMNQAETLLTLTLVASGIHPIHPEPK